MGYESRFYVIEKSHLSPDKNGETWAEVIAEFNMCKLGDGHVFELVDKSPVTDCYIYDDDGNTKITKDRYDEPLKEIDIDSLIVALRKDDDGYRRIKPFLAFLKATIREKAKWFRLKILHYGY